MHFIWLRTGLVTLLKGQVNKTQSRRYRGLRIEGFEFLSRGFCSKHVGEHET